MIEKVFDFLFEVVELFVLNVMIVLWLDSLVFVVR